LEEVNGRGLAERLLGRPTSALSGVGPRRAETLARRGLRTVGDLLFYLPTRYEDRRTLTEVDGLEVGHRATFVAEVLVVDFISSGAPGRSRRILQAVVGDQRATVNLKWFRGGESIARGLEKGARLLVTGDVRRYRFSKEIIHPEIERIDQIAAESAVPSAPQRIVPRYTAPEGINPRSLRGWILQALKGYGDLVAGHLPEPLVRDRTLPSAAAALRAVHQPAEDSDVEAYDEYRSLAHQRLVLEELYLLEVGLWQRRSAHAGLPGIRLDGYPSEIQKATDNLPFQLTDGQSRAWQEIRSDLATGRPMHRLLQGDVGSGKTVVAFLSAWAARVHGYQSALMAPTELLAEQHARTLRMLRGVGDDRLDLKVGLLTASRPPGESARVREALASGTLDLVVGTHALVQEGIAYAKLAVAIIDEQHRFGVAQRAALARAGFGGLHPHTLVMTATPIPRTLSMTLYGDLDVSVIDELPPGRSPVQTAVLREGEGDRITGMVRETLARGEQVYVVYPLVEESAKSDLRSALESAERIRAAFPEAVTDVVHGRLEAGDRSRVMDRFGRGEVQILVSTTVIEVGVDVSNATLIVVEHAERFGLAQLHQLRGRVGRGQRPGRCLLVARGSSEASEARLQAMLKTTDGFKIADADLEIRGPGDFLGTRQSGHLPDLRIADLVRDADLVAVARQSAIDTLRKDANLQQQPELARAVEIRWGSQLDLSEVG
ncbi:ATP-dependent DNA helicase RecG, partial [Myxococcota bacterium]|nr:ATP-dependent DNA helicase RecG [Myxococcota bacterium]